MSEKHLQIVLKCHFIKETERLRTESFHKLAVFLIIIISLRIECPSHSGDETVKSVRLPRISNFVPNRRIFGVEAYLFILENHAFHSRVFQRSVCDVSSLDPILNEPNISITEVVMNWEQRVDNQQLREIKI